MKLKLMSVKFAALGLALLVADAGTALAATVALNGGTGSSCSYTAYSADSNGNMQVTCESVTPPPIGAPVCTLTASPTTISPGGSSVLTASCSPAATSYVWTGSGFTTTASGGNVTPATNTTYTVTGSNTAGPGNTASATVAVSVTTPPPGVPPNCTVVDVTWAPGFKYGVTPWQYLPSGKMLAFRMTVPATKKISMAGTAYADVPELLSVSTNACDFSAGLVKDSCMGSGNNNPALYNGPPTVAGAYCKTPVGSVIYYNVKHAASPDGVDTCPAGKVCKFSLYW